LNALPKLKRFLKQEASEYENIELEWIRGHLPTAYFKDVQGKVIEELALPDYGHGDIMKLFKSHKWTPRRPRVGFGDPLSNGSFGGHYYEFFAIPSPWEDANEFALSRSHDGLQGYLLTLTSKEEELFIRKLIPATMHQASGGVWLGAGDGEEEGKWFWKAGPEAGVKFGEGRGKDGKVVGSAFQSWQTREPNNGENDYDEDCAIMSYRDASAGWDDVSCFPPVRNGLIVEYGNEPPTLDEVALSSDGVVTYKSPEIIHDAVRLYDKTVTRTSDSSMLPYFIGALLFAVVVVVVYWFSRKRNVKKHARLFP